MQKRVGLDMGRVCLNFKHLNILSEFIPQKFEYIRLRWTCGPLSLQVSYFFTTIPL